MNELSLSSRQKLLVVCGPTAAGKTSLALYLAKLLNGELVSVDSRQIYRSMNIGTGKDIPPSSIYRYLGSELKDKGIGFYEISSIKVWGYDLVDPGEDFSVAEYTKIAEKIIENIRKRGKLPVLVGGTGLYIKGIVDGIPTALVPKDKDLRKTLEPKTVEELFDFLKYIDSAKALSLNFSDKKNKRRLIRAIEIASQMPASQNLKPEEKKEKTNVLFVGLKVPKSLLEKKIGERIETRLKQGFEKEIEKLLADGLGWNSQAMQSLGYRQWRQYLQGEVSMQEAKENWYKEERKYAKRQITWFKKDPRINWFDISQKKWRGVVVKLVQVWYSKG